MRVLLVGTGGMAVDYAKVLNGLNVDFVTVGRGEEKCVSFMEKTNCSAISGGIENYIDKDSDFTHAIIATDASTLSEISNLLMNKGIKNILTEKPGGLSKDEIKSICDVAKKTKSDVYIGYNRRFYASVDRALEIINQDGGVKSFNFEFTEWPHTVLAAGLPEITTRSWFLCNSTHIIDTAFFLGGLPVELNSLACGSADWTDDHVVYCGSGRTEKGVLFSYSANWNAPGRWSVEVLTNKHRLIFKPLEKLQIQELKSVKIDFDESIDYRLDTDYKPGLYREVSAFLGLNNKDLILMKTMEQQFNMMEIYEKISGRSY